MSESQTLAPLVHDLDPALFPGANLGQNGAIFVVGKRRVDTGQDGLRYSRALQANTTHYYRVTCSADVISGQFTTANPPLGNAYPELPNFDSSSFGNLADPTINWLDRSQSYIDPLTGIRLQRVTGPGDNGQRVAAAPFDFAYDLSGSWTNPNGALGKQSSVAATTSTLNAPLFLAWNEMHDYQLTWGGANFNPGQGTIDDVLLRIQSSGSAGVLSVCISLDSGQSCASHALSVNLPASAGPATPVPPNYPSPLFAGWGRAFSNWDIANKSGAAGASGATATSQTVAAPAGSFNTDWAKGVKIWIQGSGCNGNDVCTLSSVQNSGQLTTVETIANPVTNAGWQVYAAGIRIVLASGGRAAISAMYEYAESRQFIMADNPEQDYCSQLEVTDIFKDRNGKSLTTPLTGRLCNFVNGLYLAVDNGEFRLLSTYWMNSQSPLPGASVNLFTTGAFSTTDPKSFYGNVYYHTGLYRGTYTGDYTEYKPGYSSGKILDDAVTWSNIMPTGSAADVAVQFPSYPGVPAYAPSLFNTPGFSGLLDGYGEFIVTPLTGNDPICTVIRYNLDTQQIQQVLPSWTTWPLRWGGCHFAPRGAGTYQVGSFNPLNGQNVNAPLNGPFQMNVTQVQKGGVWSNNTSLTETIVQYASNTSPVVITTLSTYTDAGSMMSQPHGLTDGEPVVIWGATSNTAINSPSDSTYYAQASWSDTTLAGALDASSTTVTVADGSRITANPMISIDSEWIRCSGVSGNTLTGCTRAQTRTAAAPHTAGAVVHQINSFALYSDAALTQPVAGNGDYSSSASAFAMDLDVCPSNLDPRWTSNMLFDNVGATGRRCNTIRVSGEPSSNYAYWTSFTTGSGLQSVTVSGGKATIALSAPFSGWAAGQQIAIGGASVSALNGTFTISGVANPSTAVISVPGAPDGSHTEGTLTVKHPTEHYLYPFKGDPANLNTSSLQDLQEGDFIHDVLGGPYGEQMVVVQKKKNSETDIELTLMRFWGNQVACDKHNSDTSGITHFSGWLAYMVPGYGCLAATGYSDITDSGWNVADYRFSSEHGDIGPGNADGLYTYVSSGSQTPIVNVPFSQLINSPPTLGVINELPSFDASSAGLPYAPTTQGYGSFRQSEAPPLEKVWKADFHALNSNFGAAQDVPTGLINGMQFQNVSGTSMVYKVTSLPSGIDRKNIPLMGFSGYHYMTDMSGPGSLITDANRYNFCVADFAGECRPGSATGDIFATVPAPDMIQGGWCITNSYEYNTPCLFSANSDGGWAVQEQIDPPDTNASGGRRLTMGFVFPGRHFSFANWVASPDAQWGFLAPPWINGQRNDIFAMKLPPWPAADGVDRSGFVPLAVTVNAMPGAVTARAQFGYAENGPPDHFFCTTRQEACTTSGTPFAWLSEPQQMQDCASGCTVQIPAIAGRIVYYKIDWMDGSGQVLSSSSLNAAAATP